jgi:hypothetical protein
VNTPRVHEKFIVEHPEACVTAPDPWKVSGSQVAPRRDRSTPGRTREGCAMRKLLCSLTVLVMSVLASPGPAVAAPASVVEYDFTAFSCSLDDAGYVFVDITTAFDPYAEVGIGESFGSTSDPNDVTLGAGTVTATVELFDFDGNVVGEAVLDATFTVSGALESFSGRFRDGNFLFRQRGVQQPIDVSGTVTALGTTYDLTACGGATGHIRETANSPDAFVSVAQNLLVLDCSIETDGTFVFLSAFADQRGAFVDLDTGDRFGSAEDPTFTERTFHAEFDLVDALTLEPAGTATADATLTPTSGPITTTFDHTKRISVPLAVDGTIEISDLGTIDMSSCSAASVLVQRTLRTTPHLQPPPNDLPAGAIAIEPGEAVTTKTGGADPDGEEPTECLGAPPTYSVWYTLEGTGGQVTLDPAGSDFDTVIAVYTRDGDTFTEVACVDDDEDLQGALTFDTDAGVTYWVQVGGFFGDFGTLVLAVS